MRLRRFSAASRSSTYPRWHGAGINKCLLAKYIYGISHPSAERLTRIKETLRLLGRELAAV